MLKKLVLGASALAITGGTAFAQTPPNGQFGTGGAAWTAPGVQTSTIEQLGNNHSAVVNQAGGREGVSSIIQDNTSDPDLGHTADVLQTDFMGDPGPTFSTPNNRSVIRQGSAGFDGEGYALVTQNGASVTPPAGTNEVNIDQTEIDDGNPQMVARDRSGTDLAAEPFRYSAVAVAYQDGTGNDIAITQKGSANDAEARQGGAFGGAVNNSSEINQSDDSSGDNGVNIAFTSQEGSDNTSLVDQERIGATDGTQNAFVFQDGVGNDSTVSQMSPDGGDQNAFVVQLGTDNESDVTQTFSEDGNNNAGVFQDGTANESTVTQEDGFNNAGVSQVGEDNLSIVDQSSLVDGGSGTFGRNDAFVSQVGARNESYVTQVTSGTNEGETFASVSQDGSDNESIVDQDADDEGALTNLQSATVSQIGSDNYSYIEQDGLMQTALVNQNGEDLVSEINQRSGDDNTAWVFQSGMNNDSWIQQDGDGNFAFVGQSGMANVSDLVQNGDNNFASVNQITDTNYSWVNQQGNGNSAIVVQ